VNLAEDPRPSDPRLALLTAEVMRVPGGPFPQAAAARIGVVYGESTAQSTLTFQAPPAET
jgi:hypothetical protein